ncbi:putative 3Fe-4S ferredoxin [Nocardia brasiliensis NBRC 14402]|uniref:ferredoxin n=1 Tax=Nocardia brasiliensis TaxID=37326 RepID=UPI00045CFABB|nr:ferredoxin [Nocardia brasiliensis]ASF09148.1 ferredoxin [Nocardia brasiliensis]GAJ79342.1 putative 3Fe-4S ferredoxin [Nocardia brasiliensis NBRC 14402]SUB40212.1 Ferredoxin-2 [Nocardia brasiliensis]
MELRVDRERCIGAGMCVLTAPGMFDQAEEDGRVLALRRSPTPDQEQAVREAVEMCPSGAIALVAN